MPECNRVTPHGEIVASPLRCDFLGNRGCIHRQRSIIRPWATRRWITCALEYKGWVAPKWLPNRWTALFFYDEAVAFAAGHRPCALCRRADYDRFRTAIGMQRADDIDAILHEQRVEGRVKRRHALPWDSVPAGAFVEHAGAAHLAIDDTILAWNAVDGYTQRLERPHRGDAMVLTPPLLLTALQNGYSLRHKIADRGVAVRGHA